jgi:hypothetical protein
MLAHRFLLVWLVSVVLGLVVRGSRSLRIVLFGVTTVGWGWLKRNTRT